MKAFPLLVACAFLPNGRLAADDDPFKPPAAETILKTLRKEHPRLLLHGKTAEEIRPLIARDGVAARLYASIEKSAEKTLKEKPSRYELPDGRRLLSVSGRVLDRVEALTFAYHMTGKRQYAERAWAELEAAAQFKDWNPSHFLDTAVMTYAFAIGYDWLWQEWSPPQREILRQAIVAMGLNPAMKVYSSKRGWHTGHINWNQVCNGGIGLGALAVADEEPKLAGEILAHALASIPRAMEFYAPDGGGGEGITYWDFGSRYNVLLMAALESALGTDFGLSRIDGFRQSGDYQIFLCGAGRLAFDFSDCALRAVSTPQHFWMARKYGIPLYAWFRYGALAEGQSDGVTDLLWFEPVPRLPDAGNVPLDKLFRKVECGSMRDSWEPDRGFVVALQGGSNAGSHRHLDLGTFILEADGVRWIVDSGKESETYQRHKNHQDRNDFYRIRAEGHNTLVFNPDGKPDQDPRGSAEFAPLRSQPDRATTSLDLTRAYAEDAARVVRTFTLDRGRSFTISDEIACRKPSTVWSFFHTEADVELAADRRSAALTDKGKRLTVKLAGPPGAAFTAMPAEPLPGSPRIEKQADNSRRRKLAIRLDEVTSATLTVRFER